MTEGETQDVFREIVETSGMAVFRFDRDGRRLYVNNTALSLTGMRREELIGGRFGDMLVPEDRERAWQEFQRCISTGQPVRGFHIRHIVFEEERHASGTWVPIRDGNGEIVGLQVAVMDVTDLVRAREQAHLEAERYRSLVEATGSSVVRVDRQGRRTFVSDHSVEFSGRSKDDLRNGVFGDTMMDPEDRTKAWALLAETFDTGKPVMGLITRQLMPGGVRYASASWVPIRDATGNIVEVQTTTTDVTEVVMMRERLQRYSTLIRTAQEEERKEISRFLHDETIQTLIASSAEIRRFLKRPTTTQEALRRLEQVEGLLYEQIDALRRLSMTLRPAMLDRLGLDAAIRWFVSECCERSGVEYEVTSNGPGRRLSPTREVRVFRIVQEAVNNALHHGHPACVRVSLEAKDGWLDLIVQDNGTGFNSPNLEPDLLSEGKLGLVGMEERAKALGGILSIVSTPGEGTTVHLRCPIEGD